jgi:ribose 5-phosphate isomerase A
MPQTIFERALEFVVDDSVIGLGSGRASHRFVELLGAQVRAGRKVSGVATSQATADLARKVGIPLVELELGLELAVTVDGADEVDPRLNLVKGYGRALVREKVVAAASKQLVILVGNEKLVPALGTRGRLPIEVVPFAVPLVLAKVAALGAAASVWSVDGKPAKSDNGNAILDLTIACCTFADSRDPNAWELALQAIPGVVGTGLFLGSADIVLVGDDTTFMLGEELRRATSSVISRATTSLPRGTS